MTNRLSFVAEHRRLSLYCELGATLDDALLSRLVCGLHEAIQKRLLTEADLTFKHAMELAQGMEAAAKNAKALKPAEVSVKRFSPSNSRERQPCFRCGRSNHNEMHCKFKDAECHRCGKMGHIAPVCRSNLMKFNYDTKNSKEKQSNSKIQQSNHLVSTKYLHDQEDSDAEEFHLFKVLTRTYFNWGGV